MEREPNAENANSGPYANSPAPSTEKDTSMSETERPIPRGSKLVGPLPVARGAQNYFLGEMDDSASVGVLAMVYYCLRPGFQGNSTKALPRSNSRSLASSPVRSAAFFRTHYVAAASFVFFASLSTTGVDYRRPILRSMEDAGLKQEKLDGREEASAEKLTLIGAALGVVTATCTTRSDFWPELKSFGGRFLPPKIVPMGLGTMCIFAGGLNATGVFFQRGGQFRR